VCGVKRYLGDKNGDEALNPLDAHDKRLILGLRTNNVVFNHESSVSSDDQIRN